jgi:hypothetical protein
MHSESLHYFEVSCQLHAPIASLPEKEPLYPWIGSLIVPKAGLDTADKNTSNVLVGSLSEIPQFPNPQSSPYIYYN